MPTPPLSDELAREAADAFAKHGKKHLAAEALGLHPATFENRLRKAAERGMCGTRPVLPGFRIAKVSNTPNGEFIQQKPEAGGEFEVPAGHSIKGVSALVDAEGRELIKWVKTRAEPSAIDVAETLKAAFADYAPAAEPVAAPDHVQDELVTLIPCNDWHVGMFAWSQETDENWDLKIAERVIGAGIEDAIARSPASGVAIVLGGGDLTHADNNENRTTRSKNILDVDGNRQAARGI